MNVHRPGAGLIRGGADRYDSARRSAVSERWEMRIAFVGKGGSGKTTVSAVFSRCLAEQGHRVVAIDADINQHLAQALGHDGPAPRPLSADLTWLKAHL